MRLVAAAEILGERERQAGDDELADERADEPVRVEARPFVGVGSHHRRQRRVGQIDRGIGGHQQHVGRARVNDLARLAKVGRGESQDREHRVRNGAKQNVGTELAPPGLRPIRDDADDRINGHVPEPGDQHDRAGGSGGYLINVGVEEQQPEPHHVPDEMRGGVAQAVTQLFLET